VNKSLIKSWQLLSIIENEQEKKSELGTEFCSMTEAINLKTGTRFVDPIVLINGKAKSVKI